MPKHPNDTNANLFHETAARSWARAVRDLRKARLHGLTVEDERLRGLIATEARLRRYVIHTGRGLPSALSR